MLEVNKLVKQARIYCTRNLMSTIAEAIKKKEPKKEDFVKAKLNWGLFGNEEKDGCKKVFEVMNKTIQMREKTRFDAEIELQTKQWVSNKNFGHYSWVNAIMLLNAK